jgi:GT2 family glycosyltransferase
MAVYNGERFIREQLDSYLRQTRLPDELVVSDNASTDRTVEIVHAFAARAPFPVHLFINERNLGVSQNFERTIRESSGDIIFLSDCDDVWYPDKIELMEKALLDHPQAGIAVCDADIVDGELNPSGRRMWKAAGFSARRRMVKKMAAAKAFSPIFPALGNCMAFQARVKPLILPFPDDPGFEIGWHDYFIAWTVICSGTGGIALVPKPLVAYRKHGSNMSGPAPSLIRRLREHWRARHERAMPFMPCLIARFECAPKTDLVNPAIGQFAIRHWRTRYYLPERRLARIPLVMRELGAGRYHRFSSGLRTAVKDLLFAY